jgi:hypothetical protein
MRCTQLLSASQMMGMAALDIPAVVRTILTKDSVHPAFLVD